MGAYRKPEKGKFCFEGNGFVQFYFTRLRFALNKVQLNFSTLESDGLIFLGMDPPLEVGGITSQNPVVSFFSLEIRNGILVSKFDFGNGFRTVVHDSVGKVNDAKMHQFIMKAKNNKFVRFWIDSDTKGPKANDIDLTGDAVDSKFTISEVYIGGTPMRGYIPHE